MRLKNGDIKKAHKGAKLTHDEIVEIVSTGIKLAWHNKAPTYSLTKGVRFIARNIRSTIDI